MFNGWYEKIRAYYIDLAQDRRKGVLNALLSFFLLLVSGLYGLCLKLVLFCYAWKLLPRHQVAARVISVGNITWGGTGKTPLVYSIALFLQAQGKQPAVLIRGYGPDEVQMLKPKLAGIPILSGRDRLKSAKKAIQHFGADTLILDDGFQHWRLIRDLDIVLIDAALAFGNQRLLPRGILREPLSSLARADILVLTKTNLTTGSQELIKQKIRSYNCPAPIFAAEYRPRGLGNLVTGAQVDLASIKNKNIALLCAIANPDSFAQSLKMLEAQVALKFNFSDHHRYHRKDLARIANICLAHQITTVLTTEKDAVKLKALVKPFTEQLEFLVLDAEVKIVQNEQNFFSQVAGQPEQQSYSILILGDGKAGHLNQAQAVAEIIKIRKTAGHRIAKAQVQIEQVRFRNRFCRGLLNLCAIFSTERCSNCLLCLRVCLNQESFQRLIKVGADVIVSCGSSLSAVSLFLSYRNKARKISIMKPALLNWRRFDLVILPEHDRSKKKKNVVLTRLAPNLVTPEYLQTQAKLLSAKYQINRPNIGLLLGGDSANFKLTTQLASEVINQLKQAAEKLNYQLLISTSRRTPRAVEQLLKRELAGFPRCQLLVIANEKNIPEALGGILALSDIVLVSGESISMVSEAVSAEKFTLVFNLVKNRRGLTKQERFLNKLAQQRIIKIARPDEIAQALEHLSKVKPAKNKIKDRQLIAQAVDKIE